MKYILTILVTTFLVGSAVSAVETHSARYDNEVAHYLAVGSRLMALGFSQYHVQWPSVELSRECKESYCFRYSGVDANGRYGAGIARTYLEVSLGGF